MGHIEIESPYAPLLQPGILTVKNVQDCLWKIGVRDLGARYLMAPKTWFVLQCVRPEELAKSRASYTFFPCRWDFSADVDPDKVSVQFMLPDGLAYEISALDPNDLARIRIPKRIPLLEAASL